MRGHRPQDGRTLLHTLNEYRVDLQQRTFGYCGHLYARTCRIGLGEELRIHPIDLGEGGQIGKIHGQPHTIRHGISGRVGDRTYVPEGLLGLSGRSGRHLTRDRVDGQLTGHEEHTVAFYSL